jgi:hypothetical protein
MRSTEDASWYELRPNGHLAVGVANPKRYPDLEAAEAAARAMRERYPDFRFVEVVNIEYRDGKDSQATPVGRF